jgi:cobyrinic acid a,c-diamide synthase
LYGFDFMALIIAGERSGVGKTTVTLAILAYLRRITQLFALETVQSFKVGPDYIDPMFHRYVTGRPCRNLDPILTSEGYVQDCFAGHSQSADYAVIEGVMGLHDGASGDHDWGSTAHVSRILGVPFLLVIDCSRLSRSVGAIAHGYTTYDPRVTCAGVVLNRVGSDRHLDLLKAALEPLDLPILGVFRRHNSMSIPDRHLGLIPTAELPALDALIEQWADLAEVSFDWVQLLPLLRRAGMVEPPLAPTRTEPLFSRRSEYTHQSILTSCSRLRIAVAYDQAFSFYYADNFDILIQQGAELVFWSPLQDTRLPEGVCGLYLGGGFPEVFAQELAINQAAKDSVKTAIQSGMPTYAECGGLMYLCDRLVDFDGKSWPMVGVLAASAQMQARLTLGYRRAIAQHDTPIVQKGTTVWGHEFHRSTVDQLPQEPLYQMGGYDSDCTAQPEGWRSHAVHASYLHLHWGTQPELPARFLDACQTFMIRQWAG